VAADLDPGGPSYGNEQGPRAKLSKRGAQFSRLSWRSLD